MWSHRVTCKYTTSAFPSYKHSLEGDTAANGFTYLATDILLIPRPTDGRRLSWPGWLTHSGRLTHEVVTRRPQIRCISGKVRQLVRHRNPNHWATVVTPSQKKAGYVSQMPHSPPNQQCQSSDKYRSTWNKNAAASLHQTGPAYSLDHSQSPQSRTLACTNTAIHSPRVTTI